MVARHPEVSPWFALLLAIYPTVETVYSIVRRSFRKMNPGLPDAAHLHQLIYKRLMRWTIYSGEHRHKLIRNSMTSPYLWLLSSLGVVPAVLFWRQTQVLILFVGLFVFGYVWFYRSIVRFRSPRWMIVKKKTVAQRESKS